MAFNAIDEVSVGGMLDEVARELLEEGASVEEFEEAMDFIDAAYEYGNNWDDDDESDLQFGYGGLPDEDNDDFEA
jgi:hypothetical protein